VPPKLARGLATHRLVAALKFSKKVKLLRSLLDKSEYGNVAQLQDFLDRIENNSLRNVFAHSFLASDVSSITFGRGGTRDQEQL